MRFFPLYPLLARALAPVFGGMVDVALLVLANAPALLFGVLLVRLVRREGGDRAATERAAWFVALVPPGFVLVFAYAEAIAGCLAVAAFLALRSQRWWWAAVAGFLSGLTRPSGALLAAPAVVEGLRGLRGVSASEAVGRVAAVAGPVAGVGTYLVWVGARWPTPDPPLRRPRCLRRPFRGQRRSLPAPRRRRRPRGRRVRAVAGLVRRLRGGDARRGPQRPALGFGGALLLLGLPIGAGHRVAHEEPPG